MASADWFLITASPYYRQPVFPYDKSRIWLMSKVTRSPSETEANWKTEEEDDMTEGDLGYGLGGRPGGIYEVSCSSTSKKRSDGRNLSPPPFPRKGEERSETIFQYSGTEGLWDTCPHGCRATGYGRQDTCAHGRRVSGYRRQSSTGENFSAASLLPPLVQIISALTLLARENQ